MWLETALPLKQQQGENTGGPLSLSYQRKKHLLFTHQSLCRALHLDHSTLLCFISHLH